MSQSIERKIETVMLEANSPEESRINVAYVLTLILEKAIKEFKRGMVAAGYDEKDLSTEFHITAAVAMDGMGMSPEGELDKVYELFDDGDNQEHIAW